MSQSGSTTQTVGSLGSSSDSGGSGGHSFYKKYQRNKQRKIVRILTVAAYIMSVSAVALVLSAYYLLIWKPSPTEPFKLKKSSPTDIPHPFSTSYHYNHQHLPPGSVQHPPPAFGNERFYKQKTKKRPYNMLPTPQSLLFVRDGISTEEMELEAKSTATPERAPASAPESVEHRLSKTTPQLLKIIAPTRPPIFNSLPT